MTDDDHHHRHHHDHPLRKLLDQRIAIIDGAMGTTIRTYGMTEADIRGERFKDSKKDLLNNGDLFSLTQPQDDLRHPPALPRGRRRHHRDQHLRRDQHHPERVLRRRSARARRPQGPGLLSEDHRRPVPQATWPGRSTSSPRASAASGPIAWQRRRHASASSPGAIGPLTVSLSNSPDADDAGFRVVTFDQVKTAYVQQVRALIAGGCDVLLVETIFDSLNAKAALVAIREVFDADGKELPVMISAAVGRGGETMISAQTVEALWNAVEAREAALASASTARSAPI